MARSVNDADVATWSEAAEVNHYPPSPTCFPHYSWWMELLFGLLTYIEMRDRRTERHVTVETVVAMLSSSIDN